jgi:hypothetical protein
MGKNTLEFHFLMIVLQNFPGLIRNYLREIAGDAAF